MCSWSHCSHPSSDWWFEGFALAETNNKYREPQRSPQRKSLFRTENRKPSKNTINSHPFQTISCAKYINLFL